MGLTCMGHNQCITNEHNKKVNETIKESQIQTIKVNLENFVLGIDHFAYFQLSDDELLFYGINLMRMKKNY